MRNSDYGLSVRIPPGLTGWGASPEAPFHGFVIFLADQPRSCIAFEVHLRVEIEGRESVNRTPTAKRVSVGNRNGREERITGTIGGTEWTNVNVTFSIHRQNSATEIDDGSITLATRTQDMGKNLPVFEEFVSHIRFEGHN
jgi:hypothetical protein